MLFVASQRDVVRLPASRRCARRGLTRRSGAFAALYEAGHRCRQVESVRQPTTSVDLAIRICDLRRRCALFDVRDFKRLRASSLAYDIQRMYIKVMPLSTDESARSAGSRVAKASSKSSGKTSKNRAKDPRAGVVKGKRLSLRVDDRDRALFDRAADANRETLTQFLVAGGRERAERLLADRTRFQLSPDAWEELVAIMDREARPNPKLAGLFSRRSAV